MTKGHIVTANSASFPPAEVVARVDDLLALWDMDFVVAAPADIRSARDAASVALANGQVMVLGAALTHEAGDRDVGMAMAELLSSFPQDKKNDLRTFTRLLAEDVAEVKASPAALSAACRGLRRTSPFLPSIAEILAAVDSQKASCAAKATLLARLPRRIAEADQALERPPAAAVGAA